MATGFGAGAALLRGKDFAADIFARDAGIGGGGFDADFGGSGVFKRREEGERRRILEGGALAAEYVLGVLALSDRAVVLERGAVTHTGPCKALLEDLDLRRKVLWL